MPLDLITIDYVDSLPLVELQRTFRTQDAIKSVQRFSDVAGNTHEMVVFGRGNDTAILYRRVDRTGHTTYARRVDSTNTDIKVDGASMWDSGADVRIAAWAHDWHPISPRDSWPLDAVIAGVVTPNPTGEPYVPGRGGAGAFVFPNSPSEGGPPVDYDRIQRGVDATGNAIIHSGVTDAELAAALAPLATPSEIESLIAAGGSFPIFAQFINTSFSAQLIVEYLLGRWDGKLPDGSVWRHPLTGRPITESKPWIETKTKATVISSPAPTPSPPPAPDPVEPGGTP